MKIHEYISDHMRELMLPPGFFAAAAVFLLVTGTQGSVLALLALIWLLFFLSMHARRYWKQRSRLKELENIMDRLEQKYLFIECLSGKDGCTVHGCGNTLSASVRYYERRLFHLLRQASASMTGAVSEAQASSRDYREYIESWVHEVKAPITAAQLICRSASPDVRRRMEGELDRISAHVERALYYARAENPEKDFLIRRISLQQVMEEAIGQHQTLLIQSGMQIEMESLDYPVYTDGKWLCFILGQLLQNAVHYRSSHPVLTLSASKTENQVSLTVSDNGIGIPAHELPRIFERGFTGSNGRTRGGSTGMGLYLCRRMASFLQIELSASSRPDSGTSILLTFPSNQS